MDELSIIRGWDINITDLDLGNVKRKQQKSEGGERRGSGPWGAGFPTLAQEILSEGDG